MDEYQVQKSISKWLETEIDATVFWGEDPPEGNHLFHFTKSNKRPDLLVSSSQNYVIEVKDGNDSAAIYDAMRELHEYWRGYEFGEVGVKSENQEINIDAFLLATQFSPEGHLFKLEREQGFRRTYDNKESGWNAEMRPQFEYARSESIPRILWRYAWYEAETRQEQSRENIGTAIGVLLSDVIDSNPGQSSMSEFDQSMSLQSNPKALIYSGQNNATWFDLG